jgi:hypothetical protein
MAKSPVKGRDAANTYGSIGSASLVVVVVVSSGAAVVVVC